MKLHRILPLILFAIIGYILAVVISRDFPVKSITSFEARSVVYSIICSMLCMCGMLSTYNIRVLKCTYTLLTVGAATMFLSFMVKTFNIVFVLPQTITSDFVEISLTAGLGISLLGLASWALSNAETIRRLHSLATTDLLTGLLNRRAFLERLSIEEASYNRYGNNVSVIMLDVDNFKSVNDTFGHDTGDKVLKAVASKINSAIREVDVSCRWSGEEFVVLCPNTDERGALLVGERVKQALNASKVIVDNLSLNITASIGVAQFNVVLDRNIEITINRADTAMYFVKQNGRNNVAAYSSIPKEV